MAPHEHPLLQARFRDREGTIHTATLSSSWVPAAELGDAEFSRGAWAAMSGFFEAQGCTLLAIERITERFYTEIGEC